MSRFEIKMVLPTGALAGLRAELLLLPAALRELHPPRVVQSVYLDTHEGDDLDDSLAGISTREKVRFRWYGEAADLVVGQFECKQRENGLGGKLVHRLARPVRVDGAPRDRFRRELVDQLPPALAERLVLREPAQWIRYRREYLGSADGALRVTLDRDLVATDQRCGFLITRSRPTPLPDLAIVELKAASQHGDLVQRWLQGVRVRPTRCSKFVFASSPAESGPFASDLY